MREEQPLALFPAYTGSEPFIFISYSHTENDQVQHFIRSMTEAGYRIWYDEGIKINEDYQHTIQKKIKESSYFIAFITNRYLTRKDPLREILLALDLRDQKKLKIIPIVLESYDLDELEKQANLFGSKMVEESLGKLIYLGFKDIQGIMSHGNIEPGLIRDVMSQIDDSCKTTTDVNLCNSTLEVDTLEAYEKFLEKSTDERLVNLGEFYAKKLKMKDTANKETVVLASTGHAEPES